MALVLVLAVGAVPLGCMPGEDCGACPGGAITLLVRDASTTMGVEGVVVIDEYGEVECDYAAEVTTCDVGGRVGTNELEITAPGYQTQTLSVELDSPYPEKGCACLETGMTRDVTLEPQ